MYYNIIMFNCDIKYNIKVFYLDFGNSQQSTVNSQQSTNFLKFVLSYVNKIKLGGSGYVIIKPNFKWNEK